MDGALDQRVTRPRRCIRLARHLVVATLAGAAGFGLFTALTPRIPSTQPIRSTQPSSSRSGVAAFVPTIDASRFASMLRGGRSPVVVVNFWASWCGPCNEEARTLAAADHRFGGHIRFLGIAVRDSSGSVSAFTGRYGIAYPTFIDPAGGVAASQGVWGLPVTRVYGPGGSIIRQWVGPVDLGGLDSLLSARERRL